MSITRVTWIPDTGDGPPTAAQLDDGIDLTPYLGAGANLWTSDLSGVAHVVARYLPAEGARP